MSKINLKNIEQKAEELNNDLEVVKTELKRIQSAKCRLKKQKGRKDYDEEMTKILSEEQLVKEVRQFLDPKEKTVTNYTQTDVDLLDYDETVKAIKSIQSKKTLSRWLTDIEGNNDEYKKACQIEKMLLEHKKTVKPIDNELYIRKTDLATMIEIIECSGDISQERIIEMLKKMLNK